jgi:type I restriction-modification system DNA methylase subunit
MQSLWNEFSPPVLYRTEEELQQARGKNPYSHFMYRAWETMTLTAIYCVNKKPTIYFKEVDSLQIEELNDLHKTFWNQGIATLLVIISKTEIQVYSGLVPPSKKTDNKEDARLVTVLNETSQALEIYNLIQQVESGKIYRENKKYFEQKNSVDKVLLDNLSNVREKISGSLKTANSSLEENEIKRIVHKLLGRIIFVCYLIDRGIIGEEQFSNAGIKNIENLKSLFNSQTDVKEILYKFFEQLRDYFNGSMFDDELTVEKILINIDCIKILQDFLNGTHIKSGQTCLDFWVYDFKVIPIETISAIYEDFLAAENKTEKRKTGAFYTPKNLAEMVVDVAVENWQGQLLGKRFLDPACGSGIFLVILFNRIAEEWCYYNPKASRIEMAKALSGIIKNQLCGIDINETACRITCFSLYLAFLDQLMPITIHELKEKYGQVLDNILALSKDDYKTTETPVIYQGNFFNSELLIANNYDLIIGNPPWVGRKDDEQAESWYLSSNNPFLEQVQKKDRTAYFWPNKEISHLFMWKTPLHLKATGHICLLLPSKVFLNTKDRFQIGWFNNFTVEKIIQLADMSLILFDNAKYPAAIVKFNSQKSEQDYCFDYEIPKVSQDNPYLGAVTVLAEDCKKIKCSEVIQAANKEESKIIWKKFFWGGERTHELLERLSNFPRIDSITGEPKKPERWIYGRGFEPFCGRGKPKPIWWEKRYLHYRSTRSSKTLFLFKSDCKPVNDDIKLLYCSPSEDLFKPPMVLINKGFTWKIFCDFPVLYQDAIRAIVGKNKDKKLLIFLCAVLNTKLASFFLFHTSSYWGVERDNVLLEEFLTLPFPLPEDTDNPENSNAIIDKVAEKFESLKKEIEISLLGRDEKVAQIIQELEPLVYEYYEISPREQILIEDTVNIFIPSSTPSSLFSDIPTLKIPSLEEKKIYIDLVCEVLNKLAKYSPFKVSAKLITSDNLDIVKLTKDTVIHEYEECNSTAETNKLLDKIKKLLPNKKPSFTYLRNLKVFDGNDLYIIKPHTLRHWTRTMALEDAGEIAKSIIFAGRN